MNPREYIEKALDLQFGDDEQRTSAKKLYQQAIQACTSEDDNFEYLYAHYELMRICSRTQLSSYVTIKEDI